MHPINSESEIELVLRLYLRRVINLETGCWLWTGATTKNGYGGIWIDGTVKYVHRVAAVLFKGFDERSGLWVLHHCDVRACFNPSHLFIGTPRDNSDDAARKGRLGRGKLSAPQVWEIKALLAQGWRQASIAERYGVSAAMISQIARGKAWKHVDETESLGRSVAVI